MRCVKILSTLDSPLSYRPVQPGPTRFDQVGPELRMAPCPQARGARRARRARGTHGARCHS